MASSSCATARAETGGDKPDVAHEVPELPEGARLPEDLSPCASPWLDACVDFIREWSPRSFTGFCEAVALWVLSVVAARRVYLPFSKAYFTPLYIGLVARTSLYAKSTAADVGVDILRAAGLDWLLAPDDATPQAFIQALTPLVPNGFDDMEAEDRERAMLRLSLTAQRGWYYEEFGQHLEAMTREGSYMATFRGMLRRFDDCKDRYECATISRGNDVVERPYLALLANLTPADLRPLAKRGASLWNDGFLARFALVAPDGANLSRERFPPGARIVPPYLSEALVEWHHRLGLPEISIPAQDDEEAGGKGKPGKRRLAVVTPRAPQECTLGANVEDAFYAYHDGLLDIVQQSDLSDLDGNYARSAEKALRVAMLLASLEDHGRIEMRHWAKAQAITERWRRGLHALYAELNQPAPSAERELDDRVYAMVERLGTPTAREVFQHINTKGLSIGDVVGSLTRQVRAGLLAAIPAGKTVRYEVTEAATVEG